MTLERLREILDAYGARPERWPAAERDSASALIAASTEAAKMRDGARRLDALLDEAPMHRVSLDTARIVAGVAAMSGNVRRFPQHRRAAFSGLWPSFAGLAAAAAAGFVVGWLNLAPGYGLTTVADNGDIAISDGYSEVQPW
jgi:hypothetical protein